MKNMLNGTFGSRLYRDVVEDKYCVELFLESLIGQLDIKLLLSLFFRSINYV
jgi:hypothetical protein